MWNKKLSGGFGDRLTGIVSSFLYALLANKTFLIDWPALSEAYQPNKVDWRCDLCSQRELELGAALVEFPGQSATSMRGDALGERGDALLSNMLIKLTASNRPTIVRESRGILNRFLDQNAERLSSSSLRAFMRQVTTMGLTLQNAFSWLHSVLFEPSQKLYRHCASA